MQKHEHAGGPHFECLGHAGVVESRIVAEMKLTGRSPCEVVSDAAVNWLRSRRQRRHIHAEATACAVAQVGSVSDLHE